MVDLIRRLQRWRRCKIRDACAGHVWYRIVNEDGTVLWRYCPRCRSSDGVC